MTNHLTTNGSDPLEEAHLAYIRGQKQEARDLLDQHLSAHPNDSNAISLRGRIESEIVEDATVQNTMAQRAEPTFELTGSQIVGVAILSILALSAGIWRGVEIILLGLHVGFSTEVAMNPNFSKLGSSHYPVHVGLIYPILLIAGGSFGFRVVYTNLRAFTSGE